jgi:single-stranded DNA-binding protein
MNILTLAGKLSSAPEVRHSTTGEARLSFIFSFPSPDPNNAETIQRIKVMIFGKKVEDIKPLLEATPLDTALIVRGRVEIQNDKVGDKVTKRVTLIANQVYSGSGEMLTSTITAPANPLPTQAKSSVAPAAVSPPPNTTTSTSKPETRKSTSGSGSGKKRPVTVPASTSEAVDGDDIPF